ncbi:hypothetical protein LX36DRAFT_449927 [Colletotrichum falcatum]|nr:hypothetical protein LX36DRAFT_449927 [Colletotrichum falcatum]
MADAIPAAFHRLHLVCSTPQTVCRGFQSTHLCFLSFCSTTSKGQSPIPGSSPPQSNDLDTGTQTSPAGTASHPSTVVDGPLSSPQQQGGLIGPPPPVALLVLVDDSQERWMSWHASIQHDGASREAPSTRSREHTSQCLASLNDPSQRRATYRSAIPSRAMLNPGKCREYRYTMPRN